MLMYFARNVRAAYDANTKAVVQCAECRRYKSHGQWVPEPPPGFDPETTGVSHAICDECLPGVYKRIHEAQPELDRLFGPPPKRV